MTVLVPRVQTPAGSIALDCEGGVPTLRLTGEIDLASVEAFEAERARRSPGGAGSTGQPVGVVDVSEVTFLSSTGVGLLITLTKPARATGRLPELRGLTRPVRRVLTLTGADGLFDLAA
jgi:anti-sigma B factor antagonist